jgi:hypothetical protein
MRSIEINYGPCKPKQTNPYAFNNFVKPKECYTTGEDEKSL